MTAPRLFRRIAYAAQCAGWAMRASAAGARSAYDGAQMNRVVMDWIASAQSADDAIKGSLHILRARARELGRNNSYVKRYFRMLINNVVGPMGIRLQAVVMQGALPDRKTNAAIESAWKAWARRPVSVDGKLTLRRFEQLLVRTIACDGEVFVRFWRGFEGNPYGLALQFIDADLVDHRFNRAASAGVNEIRMGVEVDSLGRPVAYHVSKELRRGGMAIICEREIIPANEIAHLYNPDRVNQTRGVTALHSVMVPAHMLDAYEQSEAVAARIAAAKMGFLVHKEGFPAPVPAVDPKAGPKMIEATPGSIEELDPGTTFETFDPTHPTAQFGAFVKQMLRKIATGLSVFYNALANDAEQVSYSSMRSFALIERDDWKNAQQDFIEMWREPLYEVWIGMATLTAALDLPSRNPARYMDVRHRPRGWSWIDPEKEVKGAKLAIDNGLATRTGFLAEKGEDIEDVFATLAAEKKLAAEYGITITGDPPADEPITQADLDDAADDAAGGNGADRSSTVSTEDVLRHGTSPPTTS